MMKNRISTSLLVFTLCWGVASATDLDGSQPLLCDSATVIECIPVEGCHQVAHEMVAAPHFLLFDFSAKTLKSTDAEYRGKSSTIKRTEMVDGKLMIQGAEDGIDGVRDGLGWTIAISQETGKMVLTASGDEVAFTIFGSCTAFTGG